MASRILSGLLSASLLACAVAAPTTDRSAHVGRAAPKCPTGVHIFVTHGHGAAETQIGPLSSTLNSIRAAIPGSTYLLTQYKSDPDNNIAFIYDIDPATEVLKANVTSYIAACPTTPIVLLGYSEGAIITMNTLCGSSQAGFLPTVPLNSSYASNIIASVVYGDESRVPLQAYDYGTCQTFGVVPRLNPFSCAPFAPNIRSYCDAPDPFCCVGGTDPQAHYGYFGDYDKNVTRYVAAQYQAYKNGTLSR